VADRGIMSPPEPKRQQIRPAKTPEVPCVRPHLVKDRDRGDSADDDSQRGRWGLRYLLSCSCGGRVGVGSGQAGGSVRCDACGRSLQVPKLRDLSKLPTEVSETVQVHRRWTPAHGLMLAGGIVAAAAWLASGTLRQPAEGAFDAEAIRRFVAARSDREIFEVWRKAFASATVARQSLESEKQLVRQTQFYAGLRWTLLIVGAAGLLAALGGGAAVLVREKPDSPRSGDR
jgi:hypothetical protein